MSGRFLRPETESRLVYNPVEPKIDEKSICHTAIVRVYAEAAFGSKPPSKQRWGKTTWEKDRFLILDTETVDNILTFGALECWENGKLDSRAVFYNDDPNEGLRKKHVQRLADICGELRLGPPLPASRLFIDYISPLRRLGGNVVGFNIAYDLSRLESHYKKACASCKQGARFINGFVHVRRFKAQNGEIVDWEYWKSKRDDRYHWRHFMWNALVIELQSTYKALTDRGDTLEGACRMFRVDFGDRPGEHVGRISLDNVRGCLHDVAKTRELCQAMLAEYNRHPINLPVHEVQSPASMVKGYLGEMGILPRLEHQPDFPKEYLGYAASAYHGGRVETLISRTQIPCMYVDALSMYPTVFDRLNLWPWVVADRLEVVELDPQEVQNRLESIRENPDQLLDPSKWPQFAFFAEVESYGAHLPTRTTLPKLEDYAYSTDDQTTCFGPVTTDPNTTIWVAGPDLVAAYLKKDGWVRIKRVWTLDPIGRMPSLKPIPLRGEYPVDPNRENLFKRLIELRKEKTGDPIDDERRNTGFKCMANSGAYGIWVETNPVDVDPEIENRKPRPVNVWANRQFKAEVDRPERHGRYYFSPIASLVTAGARLLLAFGQRHIEDEGGHIAYCDTDSLMIVANETGGLVECGGGEYVGPDGRQYIRALSREQVERILKRLEPLNPYDRRFIQDSVFKIEKVNFVDGDPRKGWRDLRFYGVRDKLYALYTLDEHGQPRIVKACASGFGVYGSPIKGDRIQESGLRNWQEILWTRLLCLDHELPSKQPEWFDNPAFMRVALSTPNTVKHYEKTCRPYDIMTAASISRMFGSGMCCKNPRPTTMSFDGSENWESKRWVCLSCGKRMRVRDDAGTLILKTYGDVFHTLLWGFQRKRLAASGFEPTISSPADGLTIPRPVRIEKIRYCGKEVVVDTSEAPIDEGLTAEEMEATPTLEYKPLAEQEARRLITDRGGRVSEIAVCARVDRTTVWRIRNGQKPRGSTAGKLLVALQKGEYDYNHLRGLVREAGVERFVRLSGLNRRTIYRFLSGRKPNKRTTVRIIFALQLVYAEREGLAA